MTSGLSIIGTGRYLPGPPITNDRLARVMDTSDEWIRQRTGVVQRHFAPEGVAAADLAYEASKTALEDARIDANEIDYIVLATMTPDHIFPGSGSLLGSKLGIEGVPALDIRQQCAGALFGLQLVHGLIASNQADTILFVGAEAHAGLMPWKSWHVLYADENGRVPDEEYALATKHRTYATIFGDGAGAWILRRNSDSRRGLLKAKLTTWGGQAEHLHIPAGFRQRPYFSQETVESWIPRMRGRDVFRIAATRLPEVVREVCESQKLALSDVDLFVAHQANERINQAVRKALDVPEHKVPSNIARYGNTSAGTIPILVDELRREGRLRENSLVCFMGLGAGLHWGAALMRF